MVKLNVELAGDVEAECYAKLTTGSRCLLWYPDDSVWHEAMIGLVTSPDSAVIYTPDGDLYREVLSCLGESGPSRLRGLLPNMNLPRNLRAPAYRFRDRITDERIKQVLRDSLDVAEAEGYVVELPKKVVDAAGQEIDLNTMFGGHFLRRRIVAPAGRMPAEGLAAENGSPKNAVVVRPATGDSVWVAAEPLGGMVLGQEVSLNMETDVQCGDRHALALRQGEWLKVEMIRVSDAGDYAERRRMLFAGTKTSGSGECPALPDKTAEKAEKSDEKEEDGKVRTLWVDTDEHGERYKRWRDVVKESYTPVFEEKPLEGPATALYLIKHVERHGGDPRLWLQLWMRAKHVESTDRTYHELKVLVDALWFAGTFDQVNIPALVSMEVVCRRIQAIVDAYANPNRPSWENAKLFTGQGTPEDIVSPTFKTYAAKKNKDELELLQARQKVRELRTTHAPQTDEVEVGDGLPGKPNKPPKKKGGGKGAGGQVES